jgi:hypothetical protein
MIQVYRHRSKLDDSVFYVGICKNKRRPFVKTGRNSLWQNVSKKHGYYVEIIANCEKWEDACELESLLISEYGRRDLNHGNLVNMTDGGDGTVNTKYSEKRKESISKKMKGHLVTTETRFKISEALKGKPSGMLGKKMSDEHKSKIGAANSIALKGKTTWMKGKNHTPESKKAISEKGKGRQAPNKGVPMPDETKYKLKKALQNRDDLNGIKVVYLITGQKYNSLKFACKELNLNYSTERNRLKRRSKKSLFKEA